MACVFDPQLKVVLINWGEQIGISLEENWKHHKPVVGLLSTSCKLDWASRGDLLLLLLEYF